MLKPKIQFREFSASCWVEHSLSDIAKIERGRFSPRPRNDPQYYGGEIPFAQTNDVSSSGGYINHFSQTLNEKGLKVSKLFPEGTILMTIAANIGYCGILSRPMACPDSLVGISCKKGTYNYFLNIYLNREQPRIDYLAPQAAQKNINIEFLTPYKIKLPKTLFEQQKIANFLTAVDTKINQLTEKHRLLKEYKKGVMQQIFSQQLRFKDKDGKAFPDWKSYPLKKVLSLQSDTLNMLDDETYELITVKRGFGGVVSRGLFKGKDVLVKNQFTIHENEFVISKRQIVHGACGLVPAALNGAIVSNEYNVFRPVEHLLDIDYFNRFTTTPLMRRAFFINSDGVHIEKLLFKTQSWLKTKVTLPCLEEQQKIAQFLQALDSKITAVSEQIEQTTQFKKGLLQQMFV
ncbi:restriction endonuclease subunit S [Vibrio vulnificus]|uniref:restriction endonuclease subunit S n=1 Tax=Vibrio vulnificus TaxID=672 RepID=UPI0019D4C512|nr:restriction endonuclease subunit S [Vibrio vulnificus]MBN8137339.1 restriction endonuclease subunit S [Vibrio vulnificus]